MAGVGGKLGNKQEGMMEKKVKIYVWITLLSLVLLVSIECFADIIYSHETIHGELKGVTQCDLNSEQPIAMGKWICVESNKTIPAKADIDNQTPPHIASQTPAINYIFTEYIYQGIENNKIKISYGDKGFKPAKKPTVIQLVDTKQAILTTQVTQQKLLITVIDEQNRISVQVFDEELHKNIISPVPK